MSIRQLRLLLCTYAALVLVGFCVDSLTEERMIPLAIRELACQASFVSIPGAPAFVEVLVTVGVALFIVLTMIVGWSGMFLRWSVGRHLFSLSQALMITLSLACKWDVTSGLAGFFGGATLLLAGLIIALVFWGPAKQLFVRTEPNVIDGGSGKC
jgi:hypothetical protein